MAEAERLRAGPFAAFRVGLAHGALRADEKRAAMADFAAGRTDLLVATTVVEVGIDVPNATVMLVEGAERFGLAQLHQLRGRVGPRRPPGPVRALRRAGHRRGRAPPGGRDPDRATASGWPSSTWRSAARGPSWACARPGRPTCASPACAGTGASWPRPAALARRTLREDPRLERPEHVLLRRAVQARFRELPRLLDA